MDNQNKFAEQLLKADGIDPANITEAERAAFRDMLASEKKRMNRLSWLPIGTMWIFAIALLGLCMSERILEKMHIPFVVGALVIAAAMLFVTFRYTLPRNKLITESSKKISKLHYLVHGKHRGIAMISRKNGKRVIHWLRIFILTAVFWIFISLSGAGVYYLLCRGWIYSNSPMGYIFFNTLMTLSFIIPIVVQGLKAPLEELVEIEEKPKQSKPVPRPDIWSKIFKSKITQYTAAAILLMAAYIGINKIGVPIDMADVALADVAKKMEEVRNVAFEKTLTTFSENQAANIRHSLVYYGKNGIRENILINEMIVEETYVNYTKQMVVGINHQFKTFGELKMTDDDLEKLAPMSPKHIVDKLLSKGKYKELGRKTFNGIATVGFEFNDKRAMLSWEQDSAENLVTRIWIDIETKLPIRLEFAGTINGAQINNTMENPTWNVELEDDFFEPVIPVGYLNLQERGLVGIDLSDWPKLKVIPGMAAEKAGVKDGDIAIQVDGKDVSHITSQSDALNLFFGKAGETVALTVNRAEQILTIQIEREPVPQ